MYGDYDKMKISRRQALIGLVGVVGGVGGLYGLRDESQPVKPFHTDGDRIDENKVFARNGFVYNPVDIQGVIENPSDYEGLPIEVSGVPEFVDGPRSCVHREDSIQLGIKDPNWSLKEGLGILGCFAYSDNQCEDYKKARDDLKGKIDVKDKTPIVLRGVLRKQGDGKGVHKFELNSIDAYGEKYCFRG